MPVLPRLALPFLAVVLVAPLPARTLIHAGILIDGASDAPRREMTVIVDGDRVLSVESGYAEPAAGDRVVELRDATVTPGWIDCHVHLDYITTPQSFEDRVHLEPGDFALRAAANARKTLFAGFTAVRNVGDIGFNNATLALKRAIARGDAIGPRIYSAGTPIGTTGGHADPTNGFNHEVTGSVRTGFVVDGPDAARRAV